jgi:hypothetical protein
MRNATTPSTAAPKSNSVVSRAFIIFIIADLVTLTLDK